MALLSVSNTGGRKNFIINGDFVVWQRGTSFAVSNNSVYTADRWQYTGSHNANCSVNAVAYNSILGNRWQSFVLGLTVSVADNSLASNSHCGMIYKMEGYDFRSLVNQVITLSFWVKSSITGTFSVSFRSPSGDRSYVATYTINSANTWEKKVITFTMHNCSTGTWAFDHNAGLSIYFTLAAGSGYITTNTNQWVNGNYLAGTNQVNLLGSTSSNIYFAQVQLELGSSATSFEHIDFCDLFNKCQRYYETGNTAHFPCVMITTNAGYITVPMQVQKRISLASGGTITLNSPMIYNSGWYSIDTPTLNGNEKNLIFTVVDLNHTYIVGGSYLTAGIWTADAEL